MRVVLSVFAIAAALGTQALLAQPAPKPPAGPAPRTSDGKPELGGLWQRPYTPDMSTGAVDMSGKPYPLENPAAETGNGRGARGPRKLPYTVWGKQQWADYDAAKGDYTGSCLPFGLTRSINSPDPMQIIQNKDYLAFLYEQNTWFHVFSLTGQAHDPKQIPTWFGDSAGHWEGDTLAVDTVNFNGKTRLDTAGHPMSDQLHVIQRLTRVDAGKIDYEITIDDPKTYTEKWKNVRTFTLRPDWKIMEYSCEENNKDFWEGRVKVPEQAR